ncbi:hypothetical protein Dimus_006681 [Dionaea muscipula]
MAIEKHWGDVLMVEFETVENSSLDDGRINILTEVEAPLNCVFKLLVDGKEFICRMVEAWSVTRGMRQDRHDIPLSLGQGHPRYDSWNLCSFPNVGTNIVIPKEVQRTPDSVMLSSSANSDIAEGGLSMQEPLSELGYVLWCSPRFLIDQRRQVSRGGSEERFCRVVCWLLSSRLLSEVMEQQREHWRPAVETRRYKHRAATRGTGTLVSIFIDNLPENMNARDLFMLANRFTSVVDVFIPNKRRVVTKSRFGFVKVLRQTNADILIRKVNGLWVRDRMIVAKKAIRVSSPEGRGTKPLHLHVEEERTQWLYCSIIDALKEGKDVHSFQEKFLKHGPLPFQLTDCGGRLLILTFTDKNMKESALAGSMALQPWFRWLKPWSNECQPGVLREAWLKCTGLPHQLWNHQNLTQVGKIWGEVLPGDHVLRMMAMAFGWVKIRTSALQPISQDVLLLNNGVSCRVHVNEETYFNPEQWVMGCKPKAQQVIFSGDRKEPEMVEEGFSSQRSFVPESPLSAGQREDAGFEADSGSLRMETTGPMVLDTCHTRVNEDRISVGGFSDLHGERPAIRAIVPFVPSVSHFQDNC